MTATNSSGRFGYISSTRDASVGFGFRFSAFFRPSAFGLRNWQLDSRESSDQPFLRTSTLPRFISAPSGVSLCISPRLACFRGHEHYSGPRKGVSGHRGPAGFPSAGSGASYRLAKLDPARLLEGYRKRPGRQTWDGEHVGKWLHAATLAWANTGDPALREKLDYVAAELFKCQLPDGYLGTYVRERPLDAMGRLGAQI